jgi:hypothetical protein
MEDMDDWLQQQQQTRAQSQAQKSTFHSHQQHSSAAANQQSHQQWGNQGTCDGLWQMQQQPLRLQDCSRQPPTAAAAQADEAVPWRVSRRSNANTNSGMAAVQQTGPAAATPAMLPVGLDAAVLEDSSSKRQRMDSQQQQQHSAAGCGAASYDDSADQSAAAAVAPAGGRFLQADEFMLDDAWPQLMHGSAAAAAPGRHHISQHQGTYGSSNSSYDDGSLQHRSWAGDDDLFDVGQQAGPAAAALVHRSNVSGSAAGYAAAAAAADEEQDDDENDEDEEQEQEEGEQQQEEQLMSADFDLSR